MEILVRGKIIAEYDEKSYISSSGNRMIRKGYVIQTANERLYFSTIHDPVGDRNVLYKESTVTVVLELTSTLYANRFYTNLRLKYCIQDGRPLPKIVNKEPLLNALSRKQQKQTEEPESDANAPVSRDNLPF